MTQQEQFGRRLRQLRREKSAREEKDIEQSDVAEAVGDTQPNVARWERGRIPRSDETLQALADYYGVSVAWLRLGHGPRVAPPTFPVIQEEPEHVAEEVRKAVGETVGRGIVRGSAAEAPRGPRRHRDDDS